VRPQANRRVQPNPKHKSSDSDNDDDVRDQPDSESPVYVGHAIPELVCSVNALSSDLQSLFLHVSDLGQQMLYFFIHRLEPFSIRAGADRRLGSQERLK
jgi:hypothetical protein